MGKPRLYSDAALLFLPKHYKKKLRSYFDLYHHILSSSQKFPPCALVYFEKGTISIEPCLLLWTTLPGDLYYLPFYCGWMLVRSRWLKLKQRRP